MPKLLIVEDNHDARNSLVDWLTLEGHSVESAVNGNEALQILQSFVFELIILDWELPDMSGLEVLRRFRAAGGHTQVIILTGRADLISKTTGLDAGADDYLTKPVNLSELSARVRSRLRRPGQYNPIITSVANVQFNGNERSVRVNDRPVHLTNKEFAVFEFLMRHRGQSFSARMLRDQIWPSESEILEDTVRVCIQSIRKKLGSANDILKTVAGAGYQINS